MTEEEKAVIRDGWNIHRNNYVRILAYVRRHIPANLREVYEGGRTHAALRRRIRDYVQRELQGAVEEREQEMRHAGPVAPWRARQEEMDRLNAVAEVPPPPPIVPPPPPIVPPRRREPLWALARRNQESFSDMLDAHQVRVERVDRILDAIEENL
ncbi:uncharacterized protein LOC119726343 [Patiria miniata]|uniref:Uncharacterized protein n=1 Tax=Patiria miniata TaxID=46514 RepID=A0A913ZS61_PATMI|nr:uncharacterized protein LOC119726343 [Patiria miniata]